MGAKQKTENSIQTLLPLNKTWYGIDLFKLIAAVLIVYLHTYNLEFRTNFSPAFIAIGAFAVAVGFDFQKLSGISLQMRKLSVGLYLLHCPFILSFDFYLRKGTLLDFPLTLAFSIIVFYSLSRFAPRLSAVLFGYNPNREKKVCETHKETGRII